MIGALLAALLATADVGTAEKGDLYDDSRVVTNVNESAFVKWGETQGKTLRITGGFGPWSSSTGGIDIAGSTLKAYGTELYPGIVRLHSPASPRMGSYLDVGSGAGIYFEGTGDMPLPAAYGLYGWESLDQRIRRLAPVHSESDPVFRRWSETNSYVKAETDPKFTRWTQTNTLVKTESDPVFAEWLGDELGGTNVFRAKTDLVVYDGTPQSPTADRLATVSGVKGLIAGATNSFPTADGDMRMLPVYLHYAEFCDSYTNDAAWYYEHADAGDFGCSARRSGNVLERNFDWTFDSAPSFVVSMAAGPDRFASVGVAHIGTNVTEAFVTSHKWSRFYRCLPGRTVDGVNERGVVCEVNVLPASGAEWETKGTRTLNSSGAVRWVLDHASSAAKAAAYLKDNVYIAPAMLAKGFSVHYMVSDPDETWIVEDGEAHEVGLSAVMTNFGLFREETSGEGYERWTNLVGGASIESQWWTKAYEQTTDPVRASDLGTADPDEQLEIFSAWLTGDRESHRGQTAGGKTWWQTVHTSVYDISNRVLKVCVQENPEWYVFSPPASGGTGISADQARTISEGVRTSHPYLEVGAGGGIYVVIPEDE